MSEHPEPIVPDGGVSDEPMLVEWPLERVTTERDALISETERLRSVMGKMAKALRKIATGEGYYGAQAGEYKAIAKEALSRWEQNKP